MQTCRSHQGAGSRLSRASIAQHFCALTIICVSVQATLRPRPRQLLQRLSQQSSRRRRRRMHLVSSQSLPHRVHRCSESGMPGLSTHLIRPEHSTTHMDAQACRQRMGRRQRLTRPRTHPSRLLSRFQVLAAILPVSMILPVYITHITHNASTSVVFCCLGLGAQHEQGGGIGR